MRSEDLVSKPWTLTYFDFADLHYASYFLTGYLQNEDPFQYRFRVSRKTPPILREADPAGEFTGILFSVLLFRAQRDGQDVYFCIDTRDSALTSRGMGYHLPLLKSVDLYFKVNYNAQAITEDSALREHARKILPAGPFFPVKPDCLLMFRPRLRPSAEMGWSLRHVLKRLRALRSLAPLGDVTALRTARKDLDVFFVMSFYQEKHSADNELRLRVMQEIRRRGLKAVTGFATGRDLPPSWAEFRVGRLGLQDYLRQQARARVAIYLRGLHNCLSFKLGYQLAMGMPIAGQKLANNPSIMEVHPRLSGQLAYEEPTEILDQVEKLLDDPAAREELSRVNAETFDRHYTPQAVTADILRRVLG